MRKTWLAAVAVLASVSPAGAQDFELRTATWGRTPACNAMSDCGRAAQLLYSSKPSAALRWIVDAAVKVPDDAATKLHGAWKLATEYLYHPCVDCKSAVPPPRPPKGFMIYSPGGRMMVALEYPPAAAPNKKGQAEPLLKRGAFYVYSGRYTLDTGTIVVAVDLTSDTREGLHELVLGYRIEGDLLTMTSSPAEPSKRPSEWGSHNLSRSVWMREQPDGED